MIEMPKIYFYVLLVGVLSCGPVVAARKTLLRCAKPIKDFGTVTEGEELSETFLVENAAKKKVTVDRIITACGCVTPHKEGFELNPGETTDLPFTFRSAGYGGKAIEYEIMLKASCGEEKQLLKLTLSGNIKSLPPDRSIRVMPMKMTVFNVVGEKHQILVDGPIGKDVWVKYRCPKWLTATVRELDQHEKSVRKQWMLEFSIIKPLSVSTAGDLFVQTNMPRFEELAVRIIVEPKPVLSVVPPVLFANVAPKKSYRKEITIKLLQHSLEKNSERNKPLALPSDFLLDNGKAKSIHIQPSSDSIQVKTLPSEQVNKHKYALTIRGCIDSPQYLRILVDNKMVRKVPIIISSSK